MKKFEDLSEIDQYKIRNHISNLVKLSLVDGKLSKSEVEILLSICDRYNMPKQEFVQIMKDGYTTNYIIPSDSYEKLEQIYDFVLLMLADKTMDPKELDLCKNLCKILRIKDEAINNLILTVIDCIQEDKSFDSEKMNLYAIIQ
ncbi:MAG: hypothetical protein SFY32_00570 [Bacteroidota bacterium]|nr:hypothetical protein [Bacteroidota bacterium]